MSTIITPSEDQINIVITDDAVNVNVTNEPVVVNVTEEIIEISTASGAYPLPTTVYSVFGRTGSIIAQDGDYDLGELGDVTLVNKVNGEVLTYDGTKWINKAVSGTGTVTSVDMTVPVGLEVSGNPITIDGTLAVNFQTGYSIPTNAKQVNWDAAYNDKINSAEVTGTTTKTLTLTQQDGGTITASWTDINTNIVTSVNGYVGDVVLTTTDIAEGLKLYYTEARVSANVDVAANTAARHAALTIGTANGLSLSSQVLSLALASATTTGALSSTDWSTFNNKVPYTGATGDVNLGEHGISQVGFSQFDLTPTYPTMAAGKLVWNDTDGTLDLGLKGGNVTLQIGQEIVARVVNKTGSDLLESGYKVVRISSAQGQRLAIQLAQANNDLNSVDTIGIVTETIANNQEGFITILGQVKEINTTGSLQGETWVDGDVLYLSPTSAGNITNIKPLAPDHMVVVAYVEYAHAIHGKIYCKVQNGYELEELHDVAVLPYIDNGVLYRDTDTNLWKSATIGTLLGYTPISLASLSATAPLAYNNTTGGFSISQAGVSTDGYLTSTDWNTFNAKQAAGNYITALSGEATASGPGSAAVTLSTSAVTGKLLTGVNITGGSIGATDSILVAFGKIQNQINGVLGGAIYQSTWNANTNTPTLTSGTGTKGYYYIVDVAGSTNLDGITDWKVGDWAIFNGTTWNKVDNSDAVSSVNGFTGAVSLTTANISEVTNLYYTEARVSANSDVSANTAARHSAVTLGTANGLTLSTQQLSLGLASTTATGALSSTDWNTFNAKQAALNGTGFVKISGTTISYDNSTYYLSSNPNGYTTNTGTVTSIATTGPITGGTITGSGTIGITQATTSASGYLSSTDWNTFNGKQAALTNPVTGTGTTNYLPKFTGASTIGNSIVQDNSSYIYVNGAASINGGVEVLNGWGININNIGNSSFWKQNNNSGTYELKYNSNAVALSVYSDNNVGIGTTANAGYKLAVNGTGRFSGNLTSNGIFIGRTSNGQAFGVGNGIDSDFGIFVQTGNIAFSNSGTASGFSFALGGSTRFSIASTGAATFSSSVTAGQLIVSAPATTSYGSLNALTNGYAYQEYKYNSTAYGYIGQHSAFISGASGTDLAVVSVNNLIFGTSGAFTERMTLTSGGNLLVGVTSDRTTARIQFARSGTIQELYQQDTSANTTFLLFSTTTATGMGSITRNSTLNSVLFNTISDYRLKHDLKDFSGLDIVNQIKMYDFAWNDNNSRTHGVIAHELQSVLSYAVHGEKDGKMMQGVDYSKLTPILTKSVQELHLLIKELQAKLATLSNN